MSILAGLRVIEAPAMGAAAWAGRHLADWGADVVVLEPAEGASLREQPPWYPSADGHHSTTWEWVSRNKRVVRGATPALARELCASADVLLVDSGAADGALGIAAGNLASTFEGRLICVAIAPFGIDGPYADYRATDLGILSLGGWVNVIGDPGGLPIRPPGEMSARMTGVHGFLAALIGLQAVSGGSPPPFIEVSAQAVSASLLVAPWLSKSMYNIDTVRRGNRWLYGGLVECADGWLGCTPLTATHWEMMCHLFNMADVLEHPRAMDPAYREEISGELYERIRPWLAGQSKMELFHRAQSWRLPGAPVQTVTERLACEQLAARGFWREETIAGMRLKAPRVPYLLSNAKPVDGEPARTAAIGAIGWAPRAPQPGPAGNAPARPFEGLRILDLSHFWAGPYTTSLFGTLGADVIKVESIQHPDAYRYSLVPRWADPFYERGHVWNDTNCDKRGVTLDLASAEGKDLFERLVPHADIVISNFSNRVMPNLGLTNERLHALNPRLIIATLPGFGPGGPWEDYVGFAIAFEQISAASMTGYEGGIPRVMGGFCDPAAGLHAAAALMLALRQREVDGRGCVVEVPQSEVIDSLFAPEQIAVQLGAPEPGLRGNRHEWMAPHNVYRVAGDDRWISIAVASDAEFAALCGRLGLAHLALDPRYATGAARKEHEALLDGLLTAALATRDGDTLEAELQAAGVMACRVARGYELPADPGLRAFGFFEPVTRPVSGTHEFKNWPFRSPTIATSHRMPPPLLGQHNAEVLTGLLDLSQGELEQLEAAQVIGTRPLNYRG